MYCINTISHSRYSLKWPFEVSFRRNCALVYSGLPSPPIAQRTPHSLSGSPAEVCTTTKVNKLTTAQTIAHFHIYCFGVSTRMGHTLQPFTRVTYTFTRYRRRWVGLTLGPLSASTADKLSSSTAAMETSTDDMHEWNWNKVEWLHVHVWNNAIMDNFPHPHNTCKGQQIDLSSNECVHQTNNKPNWPDNWSGCAT